MPSAKPTLILTGMRHLPLPVYGQGTNVRDWLFVDDHAKALWMIWKNGRHGHEKSIRIRIRSC
jgi:dTDP-glucose 4,6-dehydratase